MSYADHRRIIDIDSHVIELDDFLHRTALPEHADLIPGMFDQATLPVTPAEVEKGRELFARRQSDPAAMAKFEAAVLDNARGGLTRLGAFDPAERSHALDLFGYSLQWVLPTFSFHQVASARTDDALEAAAVSLNRAMATFCAADDRLFAVGYLPLSLGPERAREVQRRGVADGCHTFMVDTNEPDPAKPSFTHTCFDDIWRDFSDRDVPFVIHVAVNGGYAPVSRSFSNNDRKELAVGGDAPAGELGMMSMANSAQLLMGAMIFDGVFDRHERLRLICMEHGSVWLPGWLHALDFTTHNFKRLRSFDEKPSDTARRRIRVSPFAGEAVGWVIEQVGPEMLLYASDYPHPEGSGDPIGKFEASMGGLDADVLDAFFYRNAADFLRLSG